MDVKSKPLKLNAQQFSINLFPGYLPCLVEVTSIRLLVGLCTTKLMHLTHAIVAMSAQSI